MTVNDNQFKHAYEHCYVEKSISNIVKNVNVTSVTLQMTHAIIKIQLHLKSGTWFCIKIGDFSIIDNYNTNSVKIKYENQQLNNFTARFR